MENSLISIIVPVYNAEKYLKKCIDSILYQTYQNFELLLIDDGSKDDSGKICDDYAKTNNKIIVYHIENKGVSNARNFGLSKALGHYIAFIDSDDFVDETYLEKLYHRINLQESDIVFCKKNILNLDKVTKSKETSLVETNDLNYNEYIKSFFMLNANSDELIMGACWRSLFKKSIIDKYNISFNTKLVYCEDVCFLFDYLSKISSIAVVDEYLYNYVIHDDSSVNTILSNNIDKYEEFYNCVKNKIDDEFLCKQIQYQLVYYYVVQYINTTNWNKDVNNIYKSFLYKEYKLNNLIKSKNKNKYTYFIHVFVKIHNIYLARKLTKFYQNKTT